MTHREFEPPAPTYAGSQTHRNNQVLEAALGAVDLSNTKHKFEVGEELNPQQIATLHALGYEDDTQSTGLR